MKIQQKIRNSILSKLTSFLTITALVLMTSFAPSFASLANAATFSPITDTMSTQAPSANSDHTIAWTQVAGHTLTAADTVAIAFTGSGDFTANAAASWQTSDFSLTTTVLANVAPIAVGAAPACVSGVNNYTVTVSGTVLPIFTITLCSTYTSPTAGSAVTFVIKGATGGTGTLTNKSSNVESSVFTITDTGSNTDNGTGAIVVETNDIVTVTATVVPTLVFNIASPTAALGNLSSASTTTTTSSITSNTNAAGGFVLTYNGDTLKSASNTIPAWGAQAAPTLGTSQFGINAAAPTGAGCAAATGYQTAGQYAYTANTTTTISNTVVPASCTYTVNYAADVSSSQAAGNYSTAITYIDTGTF